jgi:hypothetical protein
LLLAQPFAALLTHERLCVTGGGNRRRAAPRWQCKHIQLHRPAADGQFNAIADPHAMSWFYTLAV